MLSKRSAILLLMLTLLLAFFVGMAYAGEKPAMGDPDLVVVELKEILNGKTSVILGYARSLFLGLATISLAMGIINQVLDGSSDLGNVAILLTRWILFVGFFWFVMGGGGEFFIPHLITESFQKIGEKLVGSEVMPGDILRQGMNIFGSMMSAAQKYGWGDQIVAGFSGIVLMSVFAALAGILAAALIEMYLVICGGSILLGFAGFEATREIAFTYLRYSVSIGAKILVITLIASTAVDITGNWAKNLEAPATVKEFFAILSYLFCGTLTLATAAAIVPKVVQGMLLGNSGGGGGGGIGKTIGTVTKTVAAAATVAKPAAVAAGVGIAGSAAYMGGKQLYRSYQNNIANRASREPAAGDFKMGKNHPNYVDPPASCRKPASERPNYVAPPADWKQMYQKINSQ